MPRLSFLADEHVPSVVVTALRSNGFSVAKAAEQFGQETEDTELLAAGADADRVLLTNDRDFVRLGGEIDHAGIVIYTAQELPPGRFVKAVARIDQFLTPEEMQNNVEWLEAWLD